jgi:hypothetical protein
MIYTCSLECWTFRRSYWFWLVVRRGQTKNTYKILVAEPLGKLPLGRVRQWEDNMKVNLRKVAREDRS